MYRVSPFIRHFAWALLAGTVLATIWANIAPASYYDAIEWRIANLALPEGLSASQGSITLMTLTSGGLMALFLFFLGKELWEAHMLERGSLHGGRAGVPLLATFGGMIGAVLVWVILSALFETAEEATTFGGWAVPLGSDVVLCYLVGRVVFGAGSPALHVLLLMSIGADLVGLVLVGLTLPEHPLRLFWLVLPVLASVGVWGLYGRLGHAGASERQHQRALQLWPYMVAGVISWLGVAASGLPPALGLLPIIPAIPHADRAFGLFAEAEEFLSDPLNRFAHLLVKPLIVVLFLFGLTRGGIDLGAFAPTTWITLGALWLGKPIGIFVGGVVVTRALGLALPAGVDARDVLFIGGISAMGFTVPVLALDTALPGGAMTEAARLGLALSLFAGPIMIALARRSR
ncbi:MAG: Na+/H+ antiporter NhaA [Paracoccaceae bacterium]